jgi:hypothetical protein
MAPLTAPDTPSLMLAYSPRRAAVLEDGYLIGHHDDASAVDTTDAIAEAHDCLFAAAQYAGGRAHDMDVSYAAGVATVTATLVTRQGDAHAIRCRVEGDTVRHPEVRVMGAWCLIQGVR